MKGTENINSSEPEPPCINTMTMTTVNLKPINLIRNVKDTVIPRYSFPDSKVFISDHFSNAS